MLPQNPLLQLVPGRLNKLSARLRCQIWGDPVRLECEQTTPRTEFLSFDAARQQKRRKIRRYPHYWGKLFDQSWFRVEIPPSYLKNRPYLHWMDQGEATLYINGTPWFGFDVAHRHCVLPAGTREVWIEGTCVQSAIWHPDATGLDPAGSRFEGAFLVARDEQVWEAYNDLEVLLDLLKAERGAQPRLPRVERTGVGYQPPVEEATVLYRRLLRRLDQAADAFDTGGVEFLLKFLKAIYREFPAESFTVAATLIGHAHIDLVWLWPEKIAQAKAVHSFATVDRLMDTYPEFRFSYSQPASYAAVERKSPALMKRVYRRIRDGAWEATGAMEVESDTLIPCGEALARSLIIGQEGFEQLRGEPSRLLWLPDVFGYAACLPQLMVQTGVQYFFTNKLTWNSITRFPYSSFVWQGNDGSEVLSHVAQSKYGYNGTAQVEQVKAGMLAYRQSDTHGEFLLPTGFGDGGGGPTEEMCERARRLENLASLPRTKWSGAEEFFTRLERKRFNLPRYQGELFLEHHRGVFTTHGSLKEAYRYAERALQSWEAGRCTGSAAPVDPEAWRRVVFAQFHDCLPGSSIYEVCTEAERELVTIAKNALARAAKDLSSSRGRPALFNPISYSRRRLALSEDGKRLEAYSLPPLSGAPRRECNAPLPSRLVAVGRNSLDNGIVRAVFDARGRISKLMVRGHPIALSAGGGELYLYPDHPCGHEAWDVDRHTLSIGAPADKKAERIKAEGGPLRATLGWKRRLGTSGSTVEVRYSLEAESPVLHVEYDIQWHESETLLKAIFPTHYAGRFARYGQPFGSVLRSQAPGPPSDEAQWEVPGSRWAAVCDEGERDGLFLVTEAKYGFSCREGLLTVSLIRSPRITGEDPHYARVIPPSLRRQTPPEPFSDQRRHRIRLALGHYDTASPREEHPAALAEILYTPFVAYRGPRRECGFVGLEGGESLQPAWAEPIGGGQWILRLHETLGRRGSAVLHLKDTHIARQIDLQKRQRSNHSVSRIAFRPFEIVSLLIARR